MENKKIKLDFDPMINYFKHLSTDMVIAYIVLFVGVILMIAGFMMM